MNTVEPILRDYQIQDLAFLMGRDRGALLHDPGCGKTPPVCVWLWWLWDTYKCKSAFVMPKSLLKKNRDEILRFTKFMPDEVIIVDGSKKKREQLMATPTGKVFLMGFDCFSREWEILRKYHPELNGVAVDEIHMGYGTNGSARTQALYKAMRRIRFFCAMTGTLVNGRLSSTYPTIHIIEPRYYGSYWQFLQEHAIQDYWGSIIGWKNHQKLGAILAKHAMRRSFTEVYGEEAKVILKELCEMSPKQRAAYNEFEEQALLELEDEYLDGTKGGGVFAMRCRQIMSCPEIFGLAGNERTGKDERLLIHLEDAMNDGEPIAIFGVFQPEQERMLAMCQEVGLKAALINGNVSAAERAKIDAAFQAREIQAVVASPATAGVGFNWDHLNRMIFASLDYQDSSFMQAYRRGIRGKRKTPLKITILEYEDSIDQRIFQIVDRKTEDAQKVDPSRQKFNLSGSDLIKGRHDGTQQTI